MVWDGGVGLGWVQEGLGTCLGVKRLHGTGLGTGLVRWGGRAVSPEQDMLCWWALLAVQCPCPPGCCWPLHPGGELSHPAAESSALMDE